MAKKTKKVNPSTKSKIIPIYFNQHAYKAIKEGARKNKTSVSGFIRQLAIQGLTKETAKLLAA